jgi:molybdopterin-synthase adenylyltransferase
MARFDRQADLIKCDMRTPIMIVGAGGIGSFTTLTLAKMGFDNLIVYDFDTIEEHNLPNQFYRHKDVGRPKVEALCDIVEEFTGVTIQYFDGKWVASDLNLYRPIVLISAVDNMMTRKEMWDGWTAMKDGCWFVDGRMGADQAEVYVIPSGDLKAFRLYNTHLWLDADTAPLPCTSKATMYNVLTIASLIANNVRLALMGEPVRPAVIIDNKNVSMHYIK